MAYTPLRIRTHASLGLSTLTDTAVAAWAKTTGVPAVGVAEANTFAGALETAKTLAKAGVQPLTGITQSLRRGDSTGDLTLFARDAEGYKALLRASNAKTLANATGALDWNTWRDAMVGAEDRVVVLTGGRSGFADTAAVLADLAGFPFVFVEIERDGSGVRSDEAALVAAAVAANRPLVATTPMVAASAASTKAHEVYMGIVGKTYLADPARPTLVAGTWLCDEDTFRARFSDMPEAVDATNAVAALCAWKIAGSAPRMPRFPFVDDEDAALAAQAREGLELRLMAARAALIDLDESAYAPRLEREIALIRSMGFSGYFLIVADFIGWARAQGIPVGPGRGSGAGSLVAYALGITDIDPLPFGLLFERFLNPDRVSLPDFDIDFGQARRDEVIAYVRRRYGETQVAHIGTWGVLQARAAVKAVGRVMGVPYPVVERFAAMIPQNPTDPIRLQEAMEGEGLQAELAKADASVVEMFDVARQVEGLYNYMSTHAAGVVIAGAALDDQVPLHRDESGALVTTFAMKPVEDSGLVKFDFLGLKNLDIVDETLRFVETLDGERPNLDALAYQDSATYQMLAEGDGFGVFQVESGGMRRAMRALQVDSIQDFIALISLYRPGPMDQIATYAAVKRGEQEAAYPHPACADVLKETQGVMVYQEQVMEIAKLLAGYSLGEADLLRRAMGKKVKAEMESQRARFLEGAAAGWVSVETNDGRTLRRHALERVALANGQGTVSLVEAMEQGLEVAL
jgi:DNA polymerase III subunit alpha